MILFECMVRNIAVLIIASASTCCLSNSVIPRSCSAAKISNECSLLSPRSTFTFWSDVYQIPHIFIMCFHMSKISFYHQTHADVICFLIRFFPTYFTLLVTASLTTKSHDFYSVPQMKWFQQIFVCSLKAWHIRWEASGTSSVFGWIVDVIIPCF